MQTHTIALAGVVILFACTLRRQRGEAKPAWSEHLRGWQKLFGVIAVVGVLLIMLNPEFLALGLLGDTAFFDILVFALSVQMHTYFVRMFYACVDRVKRVVKWLGIPSPGFIYLRGTLAVAADRVVGAAQKAAHRIVSGDAMA